MQSKPTIFQNKFYFKIKTKFWFKVANGNQFKGQPIKSLKNIEIFLTIQDRIRSSIEIMELRTFARVKLGHFLGFQTNSGTIEVASCRIVLPDSDATR